MKERILIAMCGISPAVLTETVHALASRGEPPAKLVVVTTSVGKETLKRELMDSGVWNELLEEIGASVDFGLTDYHVRLIPKSDATGNADDILTSDDNARCADFILSALREFTENPDTEVLLSIAGGRKTMSVLGALAMSLLGREGDRLCHVLVNPPFDDPALSPKFFFPRSKPAFHETRTGETVSDSEAVVTLCDVPFVRSRYLFQNEYQRLPGDFNSTVGMANEKIAARIPPPDVKMIPERFELFVNDTAIALNCPEFVMYWMLLERAKNSCPMIFGQLDLLSEFADFAADIPRSRMPEIIHHTSELKRKNEDDARKIISSIAAKIKARIPMERGRDAALPSIGRGKYGVTVPPDHIVII